MIDFIININQVFSVLTMKEKEMKEIEKIIDRLSSLKEEDANLETMREFTKGLQSITSRFQSLVRRLEDMQVIK